MRESLFLETLPGPFVEAAKRRMHIIPDEAEHMIAIASKPDFCTLPPELGGGRADVLDVAILDECIGGKHKGEVAVVFLENGVEVVACAQCKQFFWCM